MLTSKKEAFAQAIADGMSQSDAYKKAYPVQAVGSSASTIYENASHLATKIAPRIQELKQATADQLQERRVWNQERFLDVAEAQRQGAVADKQWAPANGALKLIGEATGLLTDRPQDTVLPITKVTVILKLDGGEYRDTRELPEPTSDTVLEGEGEVVE